MKPILNHDLDLIREWALQWRMSFNSDPQKQAKEILFSRKHIANDHPEIRFNNIPVMKVSEHKHLGVILDSKLSFSAISMQLFLRQEEALEG